MSNWDFTPPRSKFKFRTCHSEEEIINVVKSQLFSHHVSVTVPNSVTIPKNIFNVLSEDSLYYRINSVPASEFLSNDFIDLFIEEGRLTMHTIETAHTNNAYRVHITNGKLFFLFDKKMAQEIGIEKSSSQNSSVLVLSDLKSKNFKELEKLKKKFSSMDSNIDVILAWEPNDTNICPSSVAKYFCQKNYLVKTCKIQMKQRVEYNMSVPIYNDDVDKNDFIEWLAAFNLQCDIQSDSYISSFTYLDEKETVGQICTANFYGLIPNSRIKSLVSEVYKFLNASGSEYWIAIVVKGFQNSLAGLKSGFEITDDQYQVICLKSGKPAFVCSFCKKAR